jgi:hypothetical protein
MRGAASIVATAVALAAAPANAFDPAGADIIGLRLGMPEAAIVATIRDQGFAVSRDQGALLARTRDGRLMIDVAGAQGAWRIRYVFTGHGPGEPEKIEAAIVDRFGPPDQARPMAWCQAVGRDGLCPAHAPSLRFLPGSLTLLLQSGSEGP